jgi:hypothetical protein
MGRVLIGLGMFLVLLGLLVTWGGRLGLGRLPGDIRVQRGSFAFYMPLGTSLLLSLVLTALLNLVGYLLSRR